MINYQNKLIVKEEFNKSDENDDFILINDKLEINCDKINIKVLYYYI